jgi:hypothetical protein
MDYLLTFSGTQAVLQAEQHLIRHQLPCETVPHKFYNREGCGMAIVIDERYLKQAVKTLEEAEIPVEFHLANI